MHPSRAPLSPSPFAAPPTADGVITRLRRAIDDPGLDCGCRDAAGAALDRLDAEEDLRRRGADLADVRRMRDAIVLLLGLLDDLDELAPDEPDRSVFQSVAGLFQDIAEFAAFAARAAGRAAAPGDVL